MGYYWSKPESTSNSPTKQCPYNHNSSFNHPSQLSQHQLLQQYHTPTTTNHLYNNFQTNYSQFNPQPKNELQLILLQLQSISSRLSALENTTTLNSQIQHLTSTYRHPITAQQQYNITPQPFIQNITTTNIFPQQSNIAANVILLPQQLSTTRPFPQRPPTEISYYVHYTQVTARINSAKVHAPPPSSRTIPKVAPAVILFFAQSALSFRYRPALHTPHQQPLHLLKPTTKTLKLLNPPSLPKSKIVHGTHHNKRQHKLFYDQPPLSLTHPYGTQTHNPLPQHTIQLPSAPTAPQIHNIQLHQLNNHLSTPLQLLTTPLPLSLKNLSKLILWLYYTQYQSLLYK
jgi:hypothetical protein